MSVDFEIVDHQNILQQLNENCVQISEKQLEFYQILFTSLEGHISKYTLQVEQKTSHSIMKVVLDNTVPEISVMAIS